MRKLKQLVLATSIIALGGCATQSKLTDAEIINRYPELVQLETKLKQADQEEVDLLSAALFNKASIAYNDSLSLARSGDDKAQQRLKTGQSLLNQAKSSTLTSKDELAIVLKARDRALRASADKKNAKAFSETDASLIKLGNLVAEGEIADVREERQALAKRYATLEVEALKIATAKDAEDMIRKAEKLNANDYAPRTLKQAKGELALAKKVLDSDADAREKAATHAQQAYQQASQAIQITEIIKEFKQSNMTDEQIVLWYQTQLSRAVAPVVASPDFGKPNKALISGLASEVQSVVNKARATEQSLAESRLQFTSQIEASDAERKHQAELESRFRTVQGMFTSDEAEVYRQGDNVLIRSYGFNFPSGGSEIQSANFPLLKKIITATKQFPQSKIKVAGHTDNRGSDELNMTLSTDRADKVAQFLVQVGNLESQSVSSIGFGKTQPLASNETVEGRAANRRVEILIIND